jgi:uncharacterized damage-inducible protein DinB
MTINRVETQPHADERTTLTEMLDYYRATILLKAQGLDEQQARQRLGPSDMTMLGIVRHLVEVERSWFRRRLRGEAIAFAYISDDDIDRDFHPRDDETLSAAVEAYELECAWSRTITETASLDDLTVEKISWKDGEPVSLRWILVHMIEETARHAGHADLLRESIDGTTGD